MLRLQVTKDLESLKEEDQVQVKVVMHGRGYKGNPGPPVRAEVHLRRFHPVLL